ncbi:hypothetical protein, partial [Cupriavidus numazuensis]|uniref:hypothetical protein n=1 Tax=Cupriavidus numazuensis TaxID=221992 RepID=UPI001BAC32FF
EAAGACLIVAETTRTRFVIAEAALRLFAAFGTPRALRTVVVAEAAGASLIVTETTRPRFVIAEAALRLFAAFGTPRALRAVVVAEATRPGFIIAEPARSAVVIAESPRTVVIVAEAARARLVVIKAARPRLALTIGGTALTRRAIAVAARRPRSAAGCRVGRRHPTLAGLGASAALGAPDPFGHGLHALAVQVGDAHGPIAGRLAGGGAVGRLDAERLALRRIAVGHIFNAARPDQISSAASKSCSS